MVAYPVLIILGYFYLGFIEDIWHPTWIAFVMIPIYYVNIKLRIEKER